MGKAGDSEILAADLADSIDTISNEVLSQLGSRLGRVSIKSIADFYLAKERSVFVNCNVYSVYLANG